MAFGERERFEALVDALVGVAQALLEVTLGERPEERQAKCSLDRPPEAFDESDGPAAPNGSESVRDALEPPLKVPRRELAPLVGHEEPWSSVAAQGLGQQTFVGSSGRVFPKSLKASPLLRAWLARLLALGVEIRPRHDWTGWDAKGRLTFKTPGGVVTAQPDATILALGGASWPKLGSNGAWAKVLEKAGVAVSPLKPANGGFDVAWSEVVRERFAGQPLKGVAVTFGRTRLRGEAMVTRHGLEGGVIYALSAALRDAIEKDGSARLWIDLRPDMTADELAKRIALAPANQSVANRLRKSGPDQPVRGTAGEERQGGV